MVAGNKGRGSSTPGSSPGLKKPQGGCPHPATRWDPFTRASMRPYEAPEDHRSGGPDRMPPARYSMSDGSTRAWMACTRRPPSTAPKNRNLPAVYRSLTMTGHDEPHGMVGIRRRAEQGIGAHSFTVVKTVARLRDRLTLTSIQTNSSQRSARPPQAPRRPHQKSLCDWM
jgi:hypothetical protein